MTIQIPIEVWKGFLIKVTELNVFVKSILDQSVRSVFDNLKFEHSSEIPDGYISAANFSASNSLCKHMKFARARIKGLIRNNPDYFRGCFFEYFRGTNDGVRYYVCPDLFEKKLLDYPFRSHADKYLLLQYRQEGK